MILVSIIIPVKKIKANILQEIIPALSNQTYKNFELIIVCQAAVRVKFPSFVKIIISKVNQPGRMRDIGAHQAKGSWLAFIDDDVYPSKSWLASALKHFKNQQIAAVCGPGITPSTDNLKQKVSGWLWSSWLGAGGAGVYRCRKMKKRFVDDYPTFNLLVRKKDFAEIAGFKTQFWPGEDTKFCHDLVYKLGKKILYDPEVFVYHHRREIFIPHLRQISRYGLHRGYFVKILPKTSCKIGYFAPLGLILFIFLTPIIYFFTQSNFILFFYSYILVFYFLLIISNSFFVFLKEKNLLILFLLPLTIILTHLVYGTYFIKGLMVSKLNCREEC